MKEQRHLLLGMIIDIVEASLNILIVFKFKA